MRRFRFIGDPNHLKWEVTNPIKNQPYTINHLRAMSGKNSLDECHLEEWIRMGIWEEVFEPIFNHQKPFTNESESKKLHKDTDLGYYAGLAMQGLLSNPSQISSTNFEWIASRAMGYAQELIKQLDLVNSGKEASNV